MQDLWQQRMRIMAMKMQKRNTGMGFARLVLSTYGMQLHNVFLLNVVVYWPILLYTHHSAAIMKRSVLKWLVRGLHEGG